MIGRVHYCPLFPAADDSMQQTILFLAEAEKKGFAEATGSSKHRDVVGLCFKGLNLFMALNRSLDSAPELK